LTFRRRLTSKHQVFNIRLEIVLNLLIMSTVQPNSLFRKVTRQWSKQLGISHLFFPDHREDVLHALGSPQEVEHSEVHHHALRGEDRTDVAGHVVLQTEYVPTCITWRHLQMYKCNCCMGFFSVFLVLSFMFAAFIVFCMRVCLFGCFGIINK